MSCKGCNNRLRLAVGTSGQCNACYLATRIERVVITRYPPAKAEELTHFLAKVLNTLEADSEAFEADKTAGVVDQNGYLVSGVRTARASLQHRWPRGFTLEVHILRLARPWSRRRRRSQRKQSLPDRHQGIGEGGVKTKQGPAAGVAGGIARSRRKSLAQFQRRKLGQSLRRN